MFKYCFAFNHIKYAQRLSYQQIYRRSLEANNSQKQPSRGVLKKRFSENMQQIYRRIPMSRCDFNKVALH